MLALADLEGEAPGGAASCVRAAAAEQQGGCRMGYIHQVGMRARLRVSIGTCIPNSKHAHCAFLHSSPNCNGLATLAALVGFAGVCDSILSLLSIVLPAARSSTFSFSSALFFLPLSPCSSSSSLDHAKEKRLNNASQHNALNQGAAVALVRDGRLVTCYNFALLPPPCSG
eukprot:1140758-Pelagomonas_calceolata.AAC.2